MASLSDSSSAAKPAQSAVEATPRVVISVDAMGGDRGPVAVVAGLALCAGTMPEADFILHGDEAELGKLSGLLSHWHNTDEDTQKRIEQAGLDRGSTPPRLTRASNVCAG